MVVVVAKELYTRCVICFKHCDREFLETHHHCCNPECENIYLEIVDWERWQFGESFMEALAKSN